VGDCLYIPVPEDLPAPPESLRFKNVELRFFQLEPGDASKGFVPAYHYRVHNADGEHVGRVRLRVGESPHVTICVGHLGYEIAPEHRGHGYAYQACRALENFAFSVQNPVLITVNPDNPASIRIIEKLGAEFIDIRDVPESDPHYETGARRKRRYRWYRITRNVTPQ
jgi:predicted acetyltransferase